MGDSLASIWGSKAEEREVPFPCDAYLPGAGDVYFRAVDVEAPAGVLFRWLCQLKVAPYSYDWIDNLGRRSPRGLTPGAEDLVRGQKVMEIFEIVDFERDEHLTVALNDPRAEAVFGRIALSYVVWPVSDDASRLVAKMRVLYPKRLPWAWMRRFLPWGDLLMMRKQFLTLKHLAEGQRSTSA